MEIPKIGRRYIESVAGRTIKPDGSIIELKKDAIFDRDLVKTKGVKLHGKTFTLPNVETGDIIEYQYKEVRDHEIANYLRLQFQRDIPVWNVTYHLKPLDIPWLRRASSSSVNLRRWGHRDLVTRTFTPLADESSRVPAREASAGRLSSSGDTGN